MLTHLNCSLRLGGRRFRVDGGVLDFDGIHFDKNERKKRIIRLCWWWGVREGWNIAAVARCMQLYIATPLVYK